MRAADDGLSLVHVAAAGGALEGVELRLDDVEAGLPCRGGGLHAGDGSLVIGDRGAVATACARSGGRRTASNVMPGTRNNAAPSELNLPRTPPRMVFRREAAGPLSAEAVPEGIGRPVRTRKRSFHAPGTSDAEGTLLSGISCRTGGRMSAGPGGVDTVASSLRGSAPLR